MSNIIINYKKSTIEISKSFEKKARTYGSSEYQELCKVRNEFPDYRLVVKANKSSNAFKGMNYDFMTEYMSKHDNAEERLAEFKKLCENNLSYGEIKQWFIEKYPVFAKCETRAQWILAA